MNEDEDVVWRNTVDEGKFDVRVTATDEHGGFLIVTHVESDEELVREHVPLSYGALFGPDVDDVMSWQDRAIEVIDEWYDERA